MTISNDRELRSALDALSLAQQRTLGACFAQNVSAVTNNPRLLKALKVAMTSDSTDQEREDAYKAAKSIAVQTYTSCGRDADWDAQAEHFVASACAATLLPDALLTEKFNPAWKAAIQSRMAKNCLMIESDEGEMDNEAEQQYKIATEFTS